VPAIVVGDLAVVLDGVLEHLQRGGRLDVVMTADQLNQVLGHDLSLCPV
jgi:hypothetical protein